MVRIHDRPSSLMRRERGRRARCAPSVTRNSARTACVETLARVGRRARAAVLVQAEVVAPVRDRVDARTARRVLAAMAACRLGRAGCERYAQAQQHERTESLQESASRNVPTAWNNAHNLKSFDDSHLRLLQEFHTNHFGSNSLTMLRSSFNSFTVASIFARLKSLTCKP